MLRSVLKSTVSSALVGVLGLDGGAVEIPDFVVSNKSFPDLGEKTKSGVAFFTFEADDGSDPIESIDGVTGNGDGHFEVTESGGVVSVSVTTDGDTDDLNAGPYSLTISCFSGAAGTGTQDDVTLSITIDADTYTATDATEYAAAISDMGTASSADTKASLLPGTYAWSDSVLNNQGFENTVTVESYNVSDKAVFQMGAQEIRGAVNIRLSNLKFDCTYDRTSYGASTPVISLKNTVDNFTLDNCEATGDLLSQGPGQHFQGFLGHDGTTSMVGDVNVTDNVFSGFNRALNVGQANSENEAPAGSVVVTGNEFKNFQTDGVVYNGTLDYNVLRNNFFHSPYSDPWRVQFLDYYATKASLTGAADGKEFLAVIRGDIQGSGTQTFYEQGSNLKIWRNSSGYIQCQIYDTSAGLVVDMTSTNTLPNTVKFDLLISVDTDSNGYMYLKQQAADGSGSWVQEDTETYSGETLELTSGTASIGGTSAGAELLEGYLERVMFWQGQSADLTSSTVRNYFAGDFNEKVLPSVAEGVYGSPIVAFYGDNEIWNDGENQGTGGDFVVQGGSTDNDHGDFAQGIPGDVRNVIGWEVSGNIFFTGRFDESPFELLTYQGVFFEDIASESTQKSYINFRVFDNLLCLANTIHAVSIYNAIDSQTFNNTVTYLAEWLLPDTLTPEVTFRQQWSGTTSGNIINDNVSPGGVSNAGGTTSNNIISKEDTVGSNAWVNIYDLSGAPIDRDTILAYWTAKSGGALLTASPEIGAVGTAYRNWDAETSTSRYVLSRTPGLSSEISSEVGSDGYDISITPDTYGGILYTVITTGTVPTAEQIMAGQDHTGTAATVALQHTVRETSAVNQTGNGLTASTAYRPYYVHVDFYGNESSVVTGTQFTTEALASLTASFIGHSEIADNGATVFTSDSFTYPAGDVYIAVGRRNGPVTAEVDSVVVNGNSASLVTDGTNDSHRYNGLNATEIWKVTLASETTGTTVVTQSNTGRWVGMAFLSVVGGASGDCYDLDKDAGSTTTPLNVDVEEDGIIVACLMNNGEPAGTLTWTGVDGDNIDVIEFDIRHGFGHKVYSSASVAQSVNPSFSGTISGGVAVAISVSPA